MSEEKTISRKSKHEANNPEEQWIHTNHLGDSVISLGMGLIGFSTRSLKSGLGGVRVVLQFADLLGRVGIELSHLLILADQALHDVAALIIDVIGR
jgi:hypothetical protein